VAQDGNRGGSKGWLLAEGKLARLAEVGAVFLVGGAVILAGMPFVGENPLMFQALAWVANVLMLGFVWLGLRLRGQSWGHVGLSFERTDSRGLWRIFWRSVVVFVAAMAAFVLGAIVMAIIVGRPEPADMSGYNFLSGNLAMLAVALLSVFIVSSLGEEILYRGFLITRLAELGAGGKTAWTAAIIVSSVVFGLIHYTWGPAGVVQTGFMGLALGISYLVVGRNLWVLVLAHFYMDAILMVQMYLAPR
jgi:membrane protease YdiL (CAAX protease family)